MKDKTFTRLDADIVTRLHEMKQGRENLSDVIRRLIKEFEAKHG